MMRSLRRATASFASIPAPVGGLNARDSLAAMDKKDAVILENWFPYPNYVGVRKGYLNWSTGYGATVESLMKYTNTSGASTLFAAAGTAFYNATASGAVGAAVQSGLSNAQWQSTNVITPGGSYLYCFNGVDKPRLWTGAAWVAVDGASVPAITGVTTTGLVQGCVHKNRLWMVEKNTLKAWYLPVQSVGGAASAFDLSTVFQLGGYLMAMATWTLDAGAGMDDHAVFITSEGEAAVYRGTDPASASTWALVGVFRLGSPVGRKCFAKFGGDLMVLTAEGLFPLSRGLLSSSINRQAAVTDKIQNAMSSAVSLYGANYGWSVTVFSDANMLIINVPAGNGGNYQFVQNTITSAWCTFTGWNASSVEVVGDDLYFGDSTGVRKAWQGNLDGSAVIVADALPAFSEFGGMAQNKYYTSVRPYLSTDGNPSILYGLNVDYFAQDVSGTLSYSPPTNGMVWNSMVWGSMVWGGSLQDITAIHAVGSIGRSASLRLIAQNNGAALQWAASDFLYQKGGFM